MKRKPRYDVEYVVEAEMPDGAQAQGGHKKVCTSEELEFLFGLAAPHYADSWTLACKMLARKDTAVFTLRGQKIQKRLYVTKR